MDAGTGTSTDFLFIIYSCKKNARVSNEIYERIKNKIKHTKVYILYGDQDYFTNKDSGNVEVYDDKYIILNTDDTYDTLNNKTLLLLQSVYKLYPSIKGLFKCDDDVIININHINNIIHNLLLNKIQENDYIGKIAVIKNHSLNSIKFKNNITIGIKY